MKLKAPENCQCFSHQGVEYTVAEDGTTIVPDDAVDLFSHGFVMTEVPETPEVPETTKPKGKK